MDSVISKLFSRRDLGSLQSEAPTPLYYQMYTLLKNRILDGSIPHVTRCPRCHVHQPLAPLLVQMIRRVILDVALRHKQSIPYLVKIIYSIFGCTFK